MQKLIDELSSKGWVIIHDAVDKELIHQMHKDIKEAEHICRDIQIKNGIAEVTGGTVHHLLALQPSFLKMLAFYENFDELLSWYFSGKYIINSFGGNLNIRKRTSYANNIHRDIREHSGSLHLVLNTLVMLDDFTAENGATYLMPGSHLTHPDKPSEEEFYQKAEQAIAKAGSVLVFNSNVWHAAGDNLTDQPRCSITPMFCKPFIKQQFDYCRQLGYDAVEKMPLYLQQALGYFARTPTTLDEWYQVPEKRMYRRDQG